MGVDVRLLAVILFITAPVIAQERCGYMTAIPREPRPDDLDFPDFEGVPWSQRPLLPAPDRLDVCMDAYHPVSPSMGTQVIYMDEEIEGDVTIAKLNYYGANVPYIVPQFISGSYAQLGPVIRRFDDGFWYLVITLRQDYETPGMQNYAFNVRVDGETLVAMTSLMIVNIDDNAPMIQIFEACRVPELGDPRLTECVYEVTDADGEISTRFMEFRIDSDRGDEQTFYMQGSNLANTWFIMHMTVGITTPLNFDENALHIFSVTALDSLPNSHTVTMMVQVANVEHRPPRWVEIFAVQQFDEKTTQSFTVRAIDGDTEINRPIFYRIEREAEDTFFRIETSEGGRDGAIFYVDPIDRDTLEREVFQLSIIAYKNDDDGNEAYSTKAPVVIIVNDINDNIPLPLHEEYRVAIDEETAMTLNLEEFGFHDRDLGQNAQYEVHLESVSPPGVHSAFSIAPLVGYQRQTFIMATANHRMLDYEVPEFQKITIRVVATDMNNTEFVGVALLHIDLVNWNDELPIFEQESVSVSFDETEGEGFYVGNVRANDRDIGDRVEHTLMGNAIDFLRVDSDSGDVFISMNEAFDYHRQNQYFVQIRADDTLMEPYNTAVSQLVIQLNDINNTPPTLRLPRGSPSVEENVAAGYLITNEITATDPDTTAHLVFEIDWETSYATKQGRETDVGEYQECVEILTEYINPDQLGAAVGRIVVKEIRPGITIDFEMFEVLYLTVRVVDLETVIGDPYDESTFTITIIDLNDNPPVWDEGTLDQQFSVREMSNSGVVIGSVLATDIDGPLYNQVRYTIFPNEGTPEDLVTIHFYTGQITVNTANAIDADIPPRWYLHYTVIASDRCYAEDPADCPPDPTYHDTEGQITINIIDTNNRVPEPDYENFDNTVYIYENATHLDFVSYVLGTDLDRDDIYKKVRYQINYAVNPRLLAFFAVELDTGRIYVDYTTTEVLDRDGDEPRHQIFFNLIDNFYADGDGNRNQVATDITVVLLDVNDNAPELPDPSTITWNVSENDAAGTIILPILHAPDRDEPGTDNSLVGFSILTITATDRDIDPPTLFDIRSIDTDKGELFTAVDLRGLWGTFDLYIRAYDHGYPVMDSFETYQVVVRPWNYHEPVFVFPIQDSVIRLAREPAMVNNFLVTVDGNFLDRVYATDEDGGAAGEVTFTITGNDEAVQFFDISNDGDNHGSLTLMSQFTETIREFQVTIQATDGGTEPHALSSEITFRAVFVPTTGGPIFEEATATVAFIELEAGLLERHQLPLANDLKNHLCLSNCYDIYYRITDGNTQGHFGLDPRSNEIYLVTELDRSVSVVHTLTVAASNTMDDTNPLLTSTLTVTVNVREADPRPIFVRDIYTAGISTLDTIYRELLTVQATHTDGSPVTYSIEDGSMTADPSLEAVQHQAFTLNPQTGVLTLNIQPTASMHGMFEFKVVATDPAGGTDIADVRIYLISTLNRVIFRFVNTVEKVEESVDFIAQTFSIGFEMTCNIDQVLPANDVLGLPLTNLTEVRAHFIRDDTPVLADEIEQIRSDTVLLREIQTTLNTELLVLTDFFTNSSPEVGTDSSQVYIYVLAALSAVLAFMCLMLLLAFIIRSRALNRRLEALSMTKYGSVDSGLNRVGIAAPGTNKHAVEGSNPIWNEVLKAPDFDAISDASNDSDLIGIEDLPQFRNDYFPPGDTNSLQDIVSHDYEHNSHIAKQKPPVATHDNNFGFNSTPFSPDFANSQFRK